MQFDIKTDFLYGNLQEQVYMEQPEGYNDGLGLMCKLNRSFYGLKQTPRCWSGMWTLPELWVDIFLKYC